MSELASLWLPIVISAVAVFIASFVAWVVIGHHNPDWMELPEEGGTIDFLQKSGIKPGQYIFPMTRTKAQIEDSTKQQRMTSGPWGTVNVWPSPMNPALNLLRSFLFYLFTSLVIAYLAAASLAPGASFSKVFQITGTAGILAYSFGVVPNAIWFGRHLRSTTMDMMDGVCFGLITGVVFGLLWPT